MTPETLSESSSVEGQARGGQPTSLEPSDASPVEMYEQFFGPAIFAPCAALLLEHAAPRPGEAVLDLACGTGQVARRVAPLVGANGSVTALDVSPAMLAMGRSLPTPEGAEIEWLEGDAVAPALPDGAFDLVTCQQGLQFFSDRVAAMEHIRRMLRPGGRAAFATWRGLEHHPVYQAMTEAELAHLEPLGIGEDEIQAPFSLGDEAELVGLLESAGFADVRIEEGTVEARFPGPDTWVRNMELASAAVVPAFAEHRDAFDEYVRAVEAATRDIVRRHTVGDHVVVPMHARIAVGTVAGRKAPAGADAYETLMVPALFAQWAPKVADAAEIGTGDSVLDLACGTGILAREVTTRVGPSGTTFGLDPSPDMLEVARGLAPSVAWREGVAESLPFPDASFDAVVSQFGFMFFEDRAKAVRETIRVLFPGGRLAVAVWGSLEEIEAYATVVDVLGQMAGPEAAEALRSPFALGDPDELRQLFEGGGAASVHIVSHRGTGRFPDVRSMLEADLRGWLPLVGIILSDEKIEAIIEEGERQLARWVTPAGSIHFPMVARIVTGRAA